MDVLIVLYFTYAIVRVWQEAKVKSLALAKGQKVDFGHGRSYLGWSIGAALAVLGHAIAAGARDGWRYGGQRRREIKARRAERHRPGPNAGGDAGWRPRRSGRGRPVAVPPTDPHTARLDNEDLDGGEPDEAVDRVHDSASATGPVQVGVDSDGSPTGWDFGGGQVGGAGSGKSAPACPGCVGRGTGARCAVCGGWIPAKLRRTDPDDDIEDAEVLDDGWERFTPRTCAQCWRPVDDTDSRQLPDGERLCLAHDEVCATCNRLPTAADPLAYDPTDGRYRHRSHITQPDAEITTVRWFFDGTGVTRREGDRSDRFDWADLPPDAREDADRMVAADRAGDRAGAERYASRVQAVVNERLGIDTAGVEARQSFRDLDDPAAADLLDPADHCEECGGPPTFGDPCTLMGGRRVHQSHLSELSCAYRDLLSGEPCTRPPAADSPYCAPHQANVKREALRDAGYTGWIDENGDPHTDEQVKADYPWAADFVDLSARQRADGTSYDRVLVDDEATHLGATDAPPNVPPPGGVINADDVAAGGGDGRRLSLLSAGATTDRPEPWAGDEGSTTMSTLASGEIVDIDGCRTYVTQLAENVERAANEQIETLLSSLAANKVTDPAIVGAVGEMREALALVQAKCGFVLAGLEGHRGVEEAVNSTEGVGDTEFYKTH